MEVVEKHKKTNKNNKKDKKFETLNRHKQGRIKVSGAVEQ